jgi:hypothetical protein
MGAHSKRWSDLKKRIEALFAENVRGRVELRSTSYRKMHDQEKRAWITFDKREIINLCPCRHWIAYRTEGARLRATEPDELPDSPLYCLTQSQQQRISQYLREQSLFTPYDFHALLFDYLSYSIEDVLRSDHPLVRALGMLDRRMGKRRLLTYPVETEHPLVRRFHAFRCEAECIRPSRKVPPSET